MAKQLVRADIGAITSDVLQLLDKAGRLSGVRPVGFYPDTAGTMRCRDGCLWLIYEYDDGAFTALHDLLVKSTNGAISLKSAGVRYEPGDKQYVAP